MNIDSDSLPEVASSRARSGRSYYSSGYEPCAEDKIDAETERDLFTALISNPDGPQAAKIRERLVKAYTAFALGKARRWLGQKKHSRAFSSEDDAISAANLGLMEAMNRFRPERGFRFVTFASPWVDKFLRLLSLESHPVRVSRAEQDLHSALMRCIYAGQSVEHAAQANGVDVETAERVLDLPILRRYVDMDKTEGPDAHAARIAPDAEIAEHSSVDDIVEHNESLGRALDGLHTLPPDVRHCVEAVVMHGQTKEYASQLLGIPRNAVAQHVQTGLRLLKEYMRKTL